MVRFCEHDGEVLGSVHCANLEVRRLLAVQKELRCIELFKLLRKDTAYEISAPKITAEWAIVLRLLEVRKTGFHN